MTMKDKKAKVCFCKANDIPFVFLGSDEGIAGFVRLPEDGCTVSDKDVISIIVNAAIYEYGEMYYPIAGDMLVFRMPDEERVYRFIDSERLVTEKAFQTIEDPVQVPASERVHIVTHTIKGDDYEILQ